jgi:hypothetical protein
LFHRSNIDRVVSSHRHTDLFRYIGWLEGFGLATFDIRHHLIGSTTLASLGALIYLPRGFRRSQTPPRYHFIKLTSTTPHHQHVWPTLSLRQSDFLLHIKTILVVGTSSHRDLGLRPERM